MALACPFAMLVAFLVGKTVAIRSVHPTLDALDEALALMAPKIFGSHEFTFTR